MANDPEDPSSPQNPSNASALSTSLPGVVDGSEGDDTVDAGYRADPEGDLTDERSRSGTGTDDDLVRLGGGSDTYFAGRGRDTIEGGAGADTYIVDPGPFVIADPVLTGFDPTASLSTVLNGGGTQQFVGANAPLTFKALDIGGATDAGLDVPALDGGIEVREPGVDGDPADLGGFATDFSEDQLGFYLVGSSLPTGGTLYLVRSGADFNDFSNWQAIGQSDLLAPGATSVTGGLRLETTDNLYWITTSSDVSLGAEITIGGTGTFTNENAEGLPLSDWTDPGGGISVSYTAFKHDGSIGSIVTQDNVVAPGQTESSELVKGGMGIAGVAPDIEVFNTQSEAEIDLGFDTFDGSSEVLRMDFQDQAGTGSVLMADATVQVSHLYDDEGEVGLVSIFRAGQLLDTLSFGYGSANFTPDIIVSSLEPGGQSVSFTPARGEFELEGYIFDRLEFSSTNEGLRDPLLSVARNDPSDFYVGQITARTVLDDGGQPTGDLPLAEFQYVVVTEPTNGDLPQFSEPATVRIGDIDTDVYQLFLRDAPTVFEPLSTSDPNYVPVNAQFTLDLRDDNGNELGGANTYPIPTQDTIVTLLLTDGTATLASGDFGTPTGYDSATQSFTVTIPAGQTSVVVEIPILSETPVLPEGEENFFLQIVGAANSNATVLPRDVRAEAVIGNPIQADPVTTSWGIFPNEIAAPESSIAKTFELNGTLDGDGVEPATSTSTVVPGYTEFGVVVPDKTITLGPGEGNASLGGDNVITPGADTGFIYEITKFPDFGRLFLVAPDGAASGNFRTEITPTNSTFSGNRDLQFTIQRADPFTNPEYYYDQQDANGNFYSSTIIEDGITKNLLNSEVGSVVNIRSPSFGAVDTRTTTGQLTFDDIRAGESMVLKFANDMSYLRFAADFNTSFARDGYNENWAIIEFKLDGVVVESGVIGSNALANATAADLGAPQLIPTVDFTPLNDRNNYEFSGFVFDEVTMATGPRVANLIGGDPFFLWFDLYAAGEIQDVFEYRVIDPVTGATSEPQSVSIVHPPSTATPNSGAPVSTSSEETAPLLGPDPAPENSIASLSAPDEIPTSADVTPEIINVSVDDAGDGSVLKVTEGQTDTVTSVQNFVAAENAAENDTITLTTAITDSAQVVGISDSAVGTFTEDGSGVVTQFGPSEAQTFSQVLALDLQGTYTITAGDEDGTIGNISFQNFEVINFDSAVCFTRGAFFTTATGRVRVENLSVGDEVETLDSGSQRVRWVGRTTVVGQGDFAPIRFEVGTIGNWKPIELSPQHRVLVKSAAAELLFGVNEVLVPAKAFLCLPGVSVAPQSLVEYFHVLFDKHEIVRVDGAFCESLLVADGSMQSLEQALIQGMLGEQPEPIFYDDPMHAVRLCLTVREGKALLLSDRADLIAFATSAANSAPRQQKPL